MKGVVDKQAVKQKLNKELKRSNSSLDKFNFNKNKENTTESVIAEEHETHKVFVDSRYNSRRWFDYQGRIGRVKFLSYLLIWLAPVFLIAALTHVVLGSTGFVVSFLHLILLLVTMYAICSTHSRRLNDLNIPTFSLVLLLVPVINILLTLILAIKEGEEDSNRYGRPAAQYNNVDFVLACIAPVFFVISIFSSSFIALKAQPEEQVAVQENDTLRNDTVNSSTVSDSDSNNSQEIDAIEATVNFPASDDLWQDVSTHTDPAFEDLDEFINEEGENIFIDK